MRLRYWLVSLAGLLCLSQTVPLAAAPMPVPAFEARYEGSAYLSKLPIAGELVLNLTYEEGDRYRMSSDIQPNGSAALLISASERVSGKLEENAILPLSYEHRVRGVKNSRTQLTFHWQEETLYAEHDDERATLPLSSGIVDPLSLYLIVMTDLHRDHVRDEYTFVDDTELKTYQVKQDGEETLQTPLGTLATLRFTQQKEGSSRITTLWFAPSLAYLPVQIVQEKKGQEVLRMSIQEVKGINP